MAEKPLVMTAQNINSQTRLFELDKRTLDFRMSFSKLMLLDKLTDEQMTKVLGKPGYKIFVGLYLELAKAKEIKTFGISWTVDKVQIQVTLKDNLLWIGPIKEKVKKIIEKVVSQPESKTARPIKRSTA